MSGNPALDRHARCIAAAWKSYLAGDYTFVEAFRIAWETIK